MTTKRSKLTVAERNMQLPTNLNIMVEKTKHVGQLPNTSNIRVLFTYFSHKKRISNQFKVNYNILNSTQNLKSNSVAED